MHRWKCFEGNRVGRRETTCIPRPRGCLIPSQVGPLFPVNHAPFKLLNSSFFYALLDAGVTGEEREKSFMADSPEYPQQRYLHHSLRCGVQCGPNRVDPTPSFGPPLAHFINELLERDLFALLAPDQGLNFQPLFRRERLSPFLLEPKKPLNPVVRQLPMGVSVAVEKGHEVAD